ncbi:MAG TPA: glycosyltransferase [Candidatus Binatia bacterium]|nr:glycosyltransferase [Candidatus Binatia bacterium]
MGTSSQPGLKAAGDRIRVCLLSDTVGLDAGTERQVVETAKRLDSNRFGVHTCCLEDSPQLRTLEGICQIAVFPTPSVNSWSGLVQLGRFRRYLRQNGIQIVHAYMNKTAAFAVLSSLASDRIVITSRLNTGYWYTPLLRSMFRLLNLRTDGIMANSQEAKRIAVETEQLEPGRVQVVYQGVDMTKFSRGLGNPSACERLGIPRGSRIVGIVANLRPVKDHALFLRAAKLVAAAVNDAVFLLVGRGELYQELRGLAGELGIGERVFFTQGEGAVMDYLSRMCVGCLTSFSEGFSNAIIEYMAAGIPTVAIDVGGNRDAIVDGETGFLVRERSPEAVAGPIIALLRDEELRAVMGAKAFQRCAELFEVGKTISQLEQFYASLLAART